MKTRYILQCGLIFIGTLVPTAIACHDVELGYIPGMNPVPVGSYAEYSLTQVASCSGNCTVFTYTWKVNGDVVDSGSNTSYGQTWSSTGTKTISVTASCGGGGSATASNGIRVVGVASVSAGGVTSTTNNPGASQTVYVAKGSPGATIPVTAAPNPSGSWPSGRPTWTNATATTPGQATFPIDVVSSTSDGTTVRATCGTSSRAIRIVVVEVKITDSDGRTPEENKLEIATDSSSGKTITCFLEPSESSIVRPVWVISDNPNLTGTWVDFSAKADIVPPGPGFMWNYGPKDYSISTLGETYQVSAYPNCSKSFEIDVSTLTDFTNAAEKAIKDARKIGDKYLPFVYAPTDASGSVGLGTFWAECDSVHENLVHLNIAGDASLYLWGLFKDVSIYPLMDGRDLIDEEVDLFEYSWS